MPLLIISNPVCGAGDGHKFVEDHVVPLLQKNGYKIDKIALTEAPDHAGTLLINFMEHSEGPLTVILSSGDGTLHELVNALAQARQMAVPYPISLVLIPSGTANALHSTLFPPSLQGTDEPLAHKLKSVQSYINGGRTVPLTLAATSIQGPTSKQSVISAVVTSTALHASILHDSERLRKDIPDISRFKIAAANNITRWYNSKVSFLPTPTGRVDMYDNRHKTFAVHPESTAAAPIVEMQGPFEYFLSTVNVDRLEPAFQITPLQSKIPPVQGSMEVVIVRPMRDTTIKGHSEEERKAFANKAGAVLGGAYMQGSHVDMNYGSDGKVALEEAGLPVVEYIRCGGWEWIPVSRLFT